MGDTKGNAGAPSTEEDKEKLGCHHEMQWVEEDKYYRLFCVFPKGNADGTDRKMRTCKLLFMGKICTQCLLNTVQNMFKLADKQFRAEKEEEAKLKAEKEKAKKGGD